ncbi:uncharacterized protein LOC136080990 [Hydra vulgaris]|uniref:Uncharacterized protein LOC136080990 n=1 Tax=Hydra vulgaris TaxID=6087 RepID=A0ABM4BZ04_HYDVU
MFYKKSLIFALEIVLLFHKVYPQKETSVILNGVYLKSSTCKDEKWNASIKVNDDIFELKTSNTILLVVLEMKNHETRVNNYTINDKNVPERNHLKDYIQNNFQVSEGSIVIFITTNFSSYDTKNWCGTNNLKLLNFYSVLDCVDPCAFETSQRLPLESVTLNMTNFAIKLKGLKAKEPTETSYLELTVGIVIMIVLVSIILGVSVKCYYKKKTHKQLECTVSVTPSARKVINRPDNQSTNSDYENSLLSQKNHSLADSNSHYASIKKVDWKNNEYEKLKSTSTCYDYIDITKGANKYYLDA